MHPRVSSFEIAPSCRRLAAALLLAVLPTWAAAATYALDLHLHSEEVVPTEFAADAALLPVVAAAKTVRPAGSQFDFMGTGSGSPLWMLPKNQNTAVLFLSVGTEELTRGDFAGPLTWTLTSVSGSGGGAAPGVFSVWNVDDFGSITPLMSSFGLTPNAFDVEAKTHTHFNYGFTAPGLYNVTFSVSAPLAAGLGGGTATGSATYSFGVFDVGDNYVFPESEPWTYQGQSFSVRLVGNEHIDMGVALVPVPEPSGTILSLLGAAGLAAVGVRRRRAGRAAGRKNEDFGC